MALPSTLHAHSSQLDGLVITLGGGHCWHLLAHHTVDAGKLSCVTRRRLGRGKARELEGRRVWVVGRDLIVPRDALDGAFAHRFGVHDSGRVVINGAVDGHTVAIEGLPNEAMRRHL